MVTKKLAAPKSSPLLSKIIIDGTSTATERAEIVRRVNQGPAFDLMIKAGEDLKIEVNRCKVSELPLNLIESLQRFDAALKLAQEVK